MFYFGEIAALTAALLWSIAVIIFKTLSTKISPLLITGLKNLIALICFVILFIILDIDFINPKFTNTEYTKIIISGALGMGIGDILFLFALSKIGANRIAILNCFEPSVILLFSMMMLQASAYQLNLNQVFGFIVVIISILIITYEQDKSDIDPKVKRFGLFLQITAILMSSFGIVLIKPILNQYTHSIQDQLWITAFRLFPGVIISWIFILFNQNLKKLFYPLFNWQTIWKIILSSGLGTFLALSFWIIGYANITKPAIASILGQTSVIFIFVLSALVLKEKITSKRFVAITAAILGVLLTIS